ncbi:MAG TPA: DNA recombination protein RmuC [Alphaproteobacteria bacterium]|nr:DNA recombination protein RmuC [Alphaproteobacteria bacterium]
MELAALLALAIGAALGAGAAALWARSALARAQAAGAAERGGLLARLDAEAARAADLAAQLAERARAAVDLQQRLDAEVARRAGFEAGAARIPALERELIGLREEVSGLAAARAELQALLEGERAAAAEKLALVEGAKAQLADAFKALSAEALAANNRQFLDLAKTQIERAQELAKSELGQREKAVADLVAPVKEALTKLDQQIQQVEQTRAGAYEGLRAQVQSLLSSQEQLRGETANLVRALRSPAARGRWGEIQLKRVVEMAGMLDHCDFFEQQTVEADGNRLRPDLMVRLPGGKCLLVDAKTPLVAYLEAVEATDDGVRRTALLRHVQHIRTHMKQLGGKGYWEHAQHTPEFVVLFLPLESCFSAALESDPGLIEAGLDSNVVIATPTTLISLLRAVHYGWRQERLAENARHISELGSELYKRLGDFARHFERVGKSLGSAVEAYNKGVGSLESRVLVSARRFRDLRAAPDGAELQAMAALGDTPRLLSAPDLLAVSDEGA